MAVALLLVFVTSLDRVVGVSVAPPLLLRTMMMMMMTVGAVDAKQREWMTVSDV